MFDDITGELSVVDNYSAQISGQPQKEFKYYNFSRAIMPFCSYGNNTTYGQTNDAGLATRVSPLSFGGTNNNANYFNLTGTTTGRLAGNQYTLPAGTDYVFRHFTTPNEIRVTHISANISNWGSVSVNDGIGVFPFLALATAPSGSNTFTVIQNSICPTSAPYIGDNPAGKFLNIDNDIDIIIPKNIQVAIVAGWYANGRQNIGQWFFVAGSLAYRIKDN